MQIKNQDRYRITNGNREFLNKQILVLLLYQSAHNKYLYIFYFFFICSIIVWFGLDRDSLICIIVYLNPALRLFNVLLNPMVLLTLDVISGLCLCSDLIAWIKPEFYPYLYIANLDHMMINQDHRRCAASVL